MSKLHKPSISTSCRTILNESVFLDAHCDTVLRMVDEEFDPAQRNEDGHLDYPRMKEGGVNVQFFACWPNPDRDQPYLERVLDLLDALHQSIKTQTKSIRLATSVDQIRENQQNGTLSAVPAVEGGHAVGKNLRTVRNLYRLGVRYMTLTWMNNNAWADASGDDPCHEGLTEFGHTVVREMNRLGMIVDLSHTSPDTFRDAITTSYAPVIASHSCCRALNDHHRNLSDEQLQRLADNGGVLGICFYPGFLDADYQEARQTYREQQKDQDSNLFDAEELPPDQKPEVSVERILDHIEHAVEVAGIEHVGLGSDFDGVDALPDGMEDCSDLPLVVQGLLDRDFSPNEVKKIMGENILRVFREVEQASSNTHN